MKNLSKKLLGPVQVIILAVIISAVASYVYAGSFAEPACSPPSSSCNADAPLNVSGSSQIKNGRLTLGAGGGLTTGLEVYSGQILVDSGNVTVTSGSVNASAFYYNSDRSLKQNITPLNDSLNKVMQLQGVSFNWKDTGRADIGLVAQDVEKVYPELVTTNASGTKQVEEGNLVAPLIEAIKAQQKEINNLQAEVNQLKGNK